MSQVKARFRLAEDLDEALKLVKAKKPTILKNFRKIKKLWEDDEYEKAEHHYEDVKRKKRSLKPVSLAPVKWLDEDK